MSAQDRVSVAVVSWNTRTLLSECLESLQADAESGLADVWVVDNASTDGSPELVRKEFPWATLIASPRNLGFGPAVNLVAARTETRWIAPSNADVRLTADALSRLVECGRRHPETAVLAPRLLLPTGSTQRSVYPFPSVAFALAYVSGAVDRSDRLARRWCFGHGFDSNREQNVPWAVGAFLLVRRSAWHQVGGFDPEQWMYAEDLDLGWRLTRAGWAIRYVPDALVQHSESSATSQAWGEARHKRWHESTYEWIARRRGPVIALIVAVVNVLGFRIRAGLTWPGAALGLSRAQRSRTEALNTARAHQVGLRSRGILNRQD